MRCDTNELISGERLASLDQAEAKKYTEVPPHLRDDAQRHLGRKHRVVVPKRSNSPLAQWAKDERAKLKAKRKAGRAGRKASR